MRLLSIDVGTSSIKAGIISDEGTLLEWAREGLSPGAEELADRWLDAIERLTARIAVGKYVDAIVVSGHGPTLVGVEASGKPAGPVSMWIDDNELRLPGDPSFYLPRIAWVREHQRDLFAKAARFISCPEYVVFALCGEAVTVLPSPEFAPHIWAPESIRAYQIDEALLPPFVAPGTRVGGVSKPAAARFRVDAGVPVHVGGADFLMCLLGTATVRPGRTCDRAGTSEGINHCSGTRVSSNRLRTLPHIVEGHYNVAGILSSTGRLFEWFRRISGQGGKSYEKMLAEIAAVARPDRGPSFFPSLRNESDRRFSGAAFFGLEPDHGIADMGRAVVDSIGYSIRDVVDTLELAGCPVSELRVSGGQARNATWNQLKADLTGRPILVPRIIDAELLGNAVALLRANGEYPGLADAAEALYRPAARVEPRHRLRAVFDEGYHRFLEMRSRVVG
jgi:xylulokinase